MSQFTSILLYGDWICNWSIGKSAKCSSSEMGQMGDGLRYKHFAAMNKKKSIVVVECLVLAHCQFQYQVPTGSSGSPDPLK